jgi:uncharacterized protein YkwD
MKWLEVPDGLEMATMKGEFVVKRRKKRYERNGMERFYSSLAIAASGVLAFSLGFALPATASDYAGEISAYRRAHGLSVVRLDSRLNAVALQQARAMASTGTVSHSAGGNFSTRVAGLRKTLAGENIGAGFRSFAEMLKQWEDSAGHRENLLMTGARKIGVASVDNPKSPYGRFWAMVITD